MKKSFFVFSILFASLFSCSSYNQNIDEPNSVNNSSPKKIYSKKTVTNVPIVTFIDDDGSNCIKSIWSAILQGYSIKMGYAIITGNVGKAGYLTLAEIKALKSAGHEIYSHSKSHLVTYDNTVTPAMLEADFLASQQWMRANDLAAYSDIIVYPGGINYNSEDKKSIIKKYFRYGISTENRKPGLPFYNSESPIDHWAVWRMNADTRSLDELKAQVDLTITNKSWLIFMNHSYELNKDKTNQINKLRALIDYCIQKNVLILPFASADKIISAHIIEKY